MGKIRSLLILALLLFQGVNSTTGKAPPYEDQEAYEVYSTILPLEWPLRDAHAKRLIIQNETKGYEMCLRPSECFLLFRARSVKLFPVMLWPFAQGLTFEFEPMSGT